MNSTRVATPLETPIAPCNLRKASTLCDQYLPTFALSKSLSAQSPHKIPSTSPPPSAHTPSNSPAHFSSTGCYTKISLIPDKLYLRIDDHSPTNFHHDESLNHYPHNDTAS